jgi:hypothetical protein
MKSSGKYEKLKLKGIRKKGKMKETGKTKVKHEQAVKIMHES